MIRSGTAASSARKCLRVPASVASASSSSSVCLAVHDAIAPEDGGAADRLRQVALAGARRAEEEHVLMLGDEARGGELVDEGAFHLLVEIKVKGVERALRITKTREFAPVLEQAVLAPTEFVGDEGLSSELSSPQGGQLGQRVTQWAA